MSNNDVFNQETNANEQESQSGVTFTDQLVGEGKKFANIEELAKGKMESDRYIEELRVKIQEAETKANDEINQKIDALMDRLGTREPDPSPSNLSTGSESDATSQGKPQNSDQNKNEPDVESLVNELLNKKEQEKTQAENLTLVNEALSKAYGEKAGEVFNTRAKELGMSVDALKSMAASTPKAFLELMMTTAKDTTKSDSFSNSRVNTEALSTTSRDPNERGWSWYRNLRKENRSQYFSPKIQEQLFNDVQKYGVERFYST